LTDCRARASVADDGVSTRSYDSRNRPSWLVRPTAERATWVGDGIGWVTTMTHGNGALAEHDYDVASRVTAVSADPDQNRWLATQQRSGRPVSS
jgi:hypothetical protein